MAMLIHSASHRFALFCATWLCLGWAVWADDEPVRLLVIDATRPAGTIRALQGVNGGPLALGGQVDTSARFREFAPPLVRLHDCHWPAADVVDLHVVFPDFAADPSSPASYDFARTDKYIQSILDTGAQIVFRLGESIEHTSERRHVHPPRDMDKWAAVCVQIVRHYNDGWAGGARHNIRYWEIWNEPENRPAMWSGTDEDYYRLYAVTAQALRQHCPGILIGGPAVGNTGQFVGEQFEFTPFAQGFLERCRRDALPLDFFSWHVYTSDPRKLARQAAEVRRLLDAAGFAKTESHLNEWNYLPHNDWGPMLSADEATRQAWQNEIGGAAGAAFSAASLLLLQDVRIDAANYFSAENQGMGLFLPDGTPHKSFYAFKAFKTLVDTPQRMAVLGDLPAGCAAAAGLSADNSQLTLLVSHYAGDPARFELVAKPGWSGTTSYEVLLLDERHQLERVQKNELTGEPRVTLELAAPAVALVRFHAVRLKP